MKRVLTFLFAAVVAISCSQSQADILITELVDGNRIAANGDAGTFGTATRFSLFSN